MRWRSTAFLIVEVLYVFLRDARAVASLFVAMPPTPALCTLPGQSDQRELQFC
jgi:hypothetical protein